jgi:hypothetical protein
LDPVKSFNGVQITCCDVDFHLGWIIVVLLVRCGLQKDGEKRKWVGGSEIVSGRGESRVFG